MLEILFFNVGILFWDGDENSYIEGDISQFQREKFRQTDDFSINIHWIPTLSMSQKSYCCEEYFGTANDTNVTALLFGPKRFLCRPAKVHSFTMVLSLFIFPEVGQFSYFFVFPKTLNMSNDKWKLSYLDQYPPIKKYKSIYVKKNSIL